MADLRNLNQARQKRDLSHIDARSRCKAGTLNDIPRGQGTKLF